MRTDLKRHNKVAYKKIIKAFETCDRTCVVHPTGTGKSYLIAAVSESYQKVLILGPNIYVLDQVHNVLTWRKRGVEYMTYQTLYLTENPHTDYDLICLDEFHRAGAKEWGTAVDRLLELNKNAKVLGTTATHIRYLDDERNMADELFRGNIASHITIAEAWSQSILPIPRYVSGLFRWDKTVDNAKEHIERRRSLSDAEKRQRIFRLINARLNWELSYGMPAILKKHLDRDVNRVIVFCGNIESIENMRREVIGWFREAGFTIASTCIMHSNQTDREQREQMRRFESDKETGVKLMFSVNMLNEGIHIPNVNAVLMLRTTSSRIIYMQQMGRCLTAANTAKPLVLDMVDNLTTTTAVKDLADEFNAIEVPQAKHEGREPRKFEVIDYMLSIKDLVDKLAPRVIPVEERISMLASFCEAHGRFPNSRKRDERPAYLNLVTLKRHAADNPQIHSLIQKYRRFKPFDLRLERLCKFIDDNGRLPLSKMPIGSDEYKEYANFRILVERHKKNHNEKFQNILDKWKPTVTDDDLLQRLKDFVAANNRLPSAYNKTSYDERALARKVKSSDHPKIMSIRKKYARKIRTLEEKILEMEKFTAEHGRRPHVSEKTMYKIWGTMKQKGKSEPRVKALMDLYGMKMIFTSQEEKVQLMQKFVEEHGRKPFKSEGRMYFIWVKMINVGKSDPRVLEMREKYGNKTTDKEPMP